jgi:hypothetical protein
MTSRKIWAGHITLTGKMKTAYGILLGNPYGKITIGGFGHRQKHFIKIFFKEIT